MNQPRPAVSAPAPWSFPTHTHTQLPNGLTLWCFDRPGQHVITAALTLALPLASEPRDREGVAALTASVLDQGTRTHPGTTFADAVEACGAALEASVGYQATQIYLNVPASRLDAGLALLAEAITQPELADAEVEREKALMLAQIDQEQANSNALADLGLRRALFVPTMRQARRRTGEADTLAQVTGDDVRAFHAAHLGPRGATLVVAGALDTDIVDRVAAVFGSWTPQPSDPAPVVAPAMAPPRAVLIPRPGAVAADVRLAHPGIDRHDPGWAATLLGMHVLGGAFLSRLNKVLREEKGFTYGVRADNRGLRTGGYAVMSASFRTDVAADAVATAVELLDVASRPFTDDELTDARTYLDGVQALQLVTAEDVCSAASHLAALGLDPTFVDATRAAYDRVTPADATAACTRVLPPRDLTVVVVGDPALAEGLRGIGIDVEVSDPSR